MTPRVKQALDFATAAHASIGQKRKYTGEDYIVHPIAVMEIVKTVPHTEEMLMAALLHDTVEDTPVTIEDIQQEFGDVVATLVADLTDISKPEDGNRKVRKEMDRNHTAAASSAAQTIKLADLIDNTKSIGQFDPNFWVVYKREKQLLLAVLSRGDATLLEYAKNQVTFSK